MGSAMRSDSTSSRMERLLTTALQGMESAATKLIFKLDGKLLPFLSRLSPSEERLLNLLLPDCTTAIAGVRDRLKTSMELRAEAQLTSDRGFRCFPMGLLASVAGAPQAELIQQCRLQALGLLTLGNAASVEARCMIHAKKDLERVDGSAVLRLLMNS